MTSSTKNTPLGVNTAGDFLTNTGLTINPVAASFMGESKRNASYTPGTCVKSTLLNTLTYAINDAYNRNLVTKTPAGTSVYDNLISIGDNTIPALGNSKPPTYVPLDPENIWARPSLSSTALSMAEQSAYQKGITNSLPGPATTGYGNYDGTYGDDLQGLGVTDQKQNATWYPYNMTNPNYSITQWGWIRCHALQAWNEFNWNGTIVDTSRPGLPSYLDGYTMPEYKEFSSSFTASESFVKTRNQPIISNANAKTFLDGVYSNMSDLISSDITGVNLSTYIFGTDLENLGLALNLAKIDGFGLPSILLQTIANRGLLIDDLALMLIATGMTTDEIEDIITGNLTPNEEQERNIYNAFLLITDGNLRIITNGLQCVTHGLTSLADLLDIKKMFPNSYSSMTVPMYNATKGLPNNSKTYYLIYQSGSVNTALDTPAMREYVGTLVPAGIPPIFDYSTVSKNYKSIPTGFDSYLQGILPKEQAIAAGAFSFSMRQIAKIETFDFQQFAKVVKGIENVTNLPLVAGTSIPANKQMISQTEELTALGSGPHGSYTMSDLFGCMSGLPYPWKLIQQRISEIGTIKLKNIYNELFLAVTWQGATITPVYETRNITGLEYRISGIQINTSGGGYGRGSAPSPIITASNGATFTVTIGTDSTKAGSVGTGEFGRVIDVIVTDPGTWEPSPPTVIIEFPPTAILAVQTNGNVSTSGTNTASGTSAWPSPMNTVVQAYIDQANTEISDILTNNSLSTILNTYWNILGTQLVIEQRTRYKALLPVGIPKDLFSATNSSVYGLIDSIREMATDTKPHMSAQTLEAISNLNSVGGQSLIAASRQERNRERLALLGIDSDINIASDIDEENTKQLITNGTIPLAKHGINNYTIPSWPSNVVTENIDACQKTPLQVPVPTGYYIPINSSEPTVGFTPTKNVKEGDITGILQSQSYPLSSTLVPSGPVTPNNNNSSVIIKVPEELDPNNLPPNLDPRFISSTVSTSTMDAPAAINEVTECNCSQWLD